MKKIILISGCSSGFGKNLAEDLDEKGYLVYAGFHDKKKKRQVNLEWESTHPNITSILLDITNDESCENAVKYVFKKEKRIDVLVNNAGLTFVGQAMTFSSRDFLRILDTNAVGAFRLSKAVIPYMMKKRNGKIINITSLIGIIAIPNLALYCSSKFALEGLGHAMRHEMMKNNIWITSLAPAGIVDLTKVHNLEKQKFAFLKKFVMPFYDYSVFTKKVDQIIQAKKPQPRIVVGLPARLLTTFQGLFHNNFFDFMLQYIGNKGEQ